MRRLLLAAAVATAALLSLPTPARAHALLSGSDPADGAQVEEGPREVTITLTEPPEPSLSHVRVLDQGGAEVQEGSAEPVPGQPLALRVGLRPLEEGVYTVTWRVVSRVDGHPTGGAFAFGVGVSPLQATLPPTPEPPSESPSLLEIAGRWALFVGLGFVVGAGWVGALAFREPPRRTLRVALWASGVAALGLAGLAVAQGRAAGAGVGALLGTPVGRALLWRAAAIWVAGVLVVVATWGRPAARRPALLAAGVVASAGILVHVASGHAAAGGRFEWASVGFQWAHFTAAGVWLGGLAALLVGVRGDTDEAKARAVRRFSAVAAFGLGAVAATGVLRAVDEVGAWGELVSSSYGVIVLVKAGLLLGLAGLGAVNRYRNVPAARRSLRGLRRVSRGELVLGAVTLAAAGTLAALVPPQSVPPVTVPPAAVSVAGSDFATSVRARLEVDPALPGPNRFRVQVTDFDSGEPVDADRVQVRFSFTGGGVSDTTLALQAEDEGDYRGVGSNLAVGGVWDVAVLVQEGDTAVEVPLQMATVCRAQEIEPPPDSAQPTIYLTEPPAGGSVEGYTLYFGGPSYEVHFTFLDEGGEEVAAGTPTITAWQPGTDPMTLRADPLSRGHFSANARLEPGRWRFDGVAPEAGLSGCFEAGLGA
ncbi:MAG: copper resistance CopC/CopD family protein [Actinomycetota bacterium]